MERKMYYDEPTMVKFYEFNGVGIEPRWLGGIAYQDVIICGECGIAVSIEDLWNEADDDESFDGAPIEELSWINISDEIIGDD